MVPSRGPFPSFFTSVFYLQITLLIYSIISLDISLLKENQCVCVCMYICILCVCVHAQSVWCTCVGEGTTLWSWLFPSTFT